MSERELDDLPEDAPADETESAVVNDLPSTSIRRPVLALVVNLLIVIAGIAAILAVEVRELPDVDRPIVTVRVTYPGASPRTMDAEVMSLLEGAVARVSGIQNMRAGSEENSGRLRIEFTPGTDLDNAAADVREAVSRVTRELPERIEQITVVKADDDSDPSVNLAVQSDVLSEEALTRVVEKDVIPMLISIKGVADVQISGNRQRMLHVVVDPLRLTSYGLSVNDVAEALLDAPFDVPAGSFRSRDQELIVRADASVVDASQVADIILRDTVRIGDVANVYFGPADAESLTRLNGVPVIGLGVVRQARSNTIVISDGVREAVERINRRFDDLEVSITDDQATFIRSSVSEVLTTLGFTIAIVIATIWLFMGSLKATLVPSITIPVALIGTVASIWLFGFSINILTLLALVLATGLVVDDAIVVLENIQRRRSQGLGPRAAAVLGTRQVFFAVVTTSLVLVSVFVPISFLPSTAGRLFREFGMVLAGAVVISSFVALSLVPAVAARLIEKPEKPGKIQQKANALGRALSNAYRRSLAGLLNHPWITVTAAIAFAAAASVAYQNLEQELVPSEDRGVLSVWASGPDGVGLNYMDRQTEKMERVLQPLLESGEARSLFTVVGTWDPNRSRINVPLVDWSQRERSQQEIAESIRDDLANIPGVRANAFGGNSLNLRRAGSGMEVALLGNDYGEIFEAAQTFTRELEMRFPELTRPDIQYNPTQPQLSVQIDRRRAADLGIDLDSLSATLRAMIDGDELIDLNIDDEAVPILLESSNGQINDPSDLINLYVSTADGQLLPLSTVVTLSEEGVAAELNRQAQRRSIEIDIERLESYPLASAVEDLNELADEVLPENVSMILLGQAAALEETSREVAITYGIALIVVFLVLCAQFEGFTSALVVTLLVPFGIAAAVLALLVTGTSLNIYSQIGLVLLIGLMAKNSVLLVEFADQLRDQGYGLRDAIEKGAAVRLRPVAMTMVSTVLGGLPLILGSGAGAEARASIGWVVFGGLGLAAVFTLYLTPALYLLLARFSSARAEETQKLAEELRHARTVADSA